MYSKSHRVLFLLGLFCLPFLLQAKNGGDLHYVVNKGQWNTEVKYKATLQGGEAFFLQHGFRYSFYSQSDMEWAHNHSNEIVNGYAPIANHAYDVLFVGSNQANIIGEEQRSYYHNYFIGNDESKWAGNVPLYQQVVYKELYDNIDMNVYSKGSAMKYDFVVLPGGSVHDIQIAFDGVTPVINSRGDLQIITSVNTVIEKAPYAYQVINGLEVPVACNYKLQNGRLTFVFPDGYDKKSTLIIDPVLIFATYTGSTGDLWAYCSAYDAYGNMFSASEAYAPGFPIKTGAFQFLYINHDIAINKYSSMGDTLLYSTYCGGTYTEHPTAMAVNSNNELVVSGQTYSNNFPVTGNAYDKFFNADSMHSDIFVTVFNSGGTALTGSTFVGGSASDGVASYAFHDNDQNKSGLCIDAQNNIYVGATTLSKNFPVTVGAFDTSAGSAYDGCAFKLSPTCSNLIYSTYLAGNHHDCIYDCKLASNNQLVLCGRTISSDFPLSTNAYSDSGKAFVTILNYSGSAVVASTKLGNYSESALKVSLDDNDKVFVCGNNDTPFVIHGASFSQSKGKIFIAKLMPDLDSLIISTKLVNTSRPGITGFVNICGDIVGSVYVKDSSNLPLTSNAYQSDYSVYYFFHIGPAMDTLIYATYFGVPFDRNGHAHGSSVIDTSGIIWLSTCNQISKHLLPGTTGSYCAVSKSRQFLDNDHLSVKFDMEVLAVKPIAGLSAPDTACRHMDVHFQNRSKSSYAYFWDFGDGDTSHAKNPVHQYDSTGTYIVKLEAYNPYSCKHVDILLDTIYIDSIEIKAKMVAADTVCRSAIVYMINQSANGKSWLWDFGDGNTDTSFNAQHTYYTGGTYTVTLVAYNPFLCNGSDTTYHIITVDDTNPEASFTVSKSTVCIDMSVQFQNNTKNGITYSWDFDDNSKDLAKDPVHSFNLWGTRNVRLIATNLNLCVPNDTAYVPIIVKEPLRIELADSFICGDSLVSWSVKVINSNDFVKYKWSPASAIVSSDDKQVVTVDPKIATKYYINVSDSVVGLCSHTVSDTGNLIIVPYPFGTFATSNSPVCEHDTLLFEAGTTSGLTGLVYSWTGPLGFSESGHIAHRNAVTRQHSGIYKIGIDNHGCTFYEDVPVIVKPVPAVSASSNAPLFAGKDLKLFMKTDLTLDSLLWEGPNNFISREANPVILQAPPQATGPYTVSAMLDGCLGGAVTNVVVDEPDSQYIYLYPSPNTGTFYVEGKGHREQEIKLIVVNSIGQRLYSIDFNTEKKYFKQQITIPAVSGGTYIVHLLMDGKYWPVPFTIKRE